MFSQVQPLVQQEGSTSDVVIRHNAQHHVRTDELYIVLASDGACVCRASWLLAKLSLLFIEQQKSILRSCLSSSQ